MGDIRLFNCVKVALVGLALVGVSVLSGCSSDESATENPDTSPLAYVTNQKGNITVIDLETLEVAGEIDVEGKGPRGIGITPDGKTIVVANVDGGDISLIDRESGAVKKHIEVGENPEFVRVIGNKAYISFEPASLGGPPPKPGSEEAMKLQEQREEDEEEPAKIAIVNIDLGIVEKEITGGMETEGIELSPDQSKLVITNEADENITVHDVASGELLKTIDTKPYGHRPRGIKASPDGSMYVGSIEYGNHLVVMDSNFDVIREVETGAVPYGLSFSRDGSKLYVALSKGKALQVFDTSSWEELGQGETGKRCWHFTFTPDDSKILVACGRSDEVVVLNAADLSVVKRLSGFAMPWGIVSYPKSVGSLDSVWQ
jgi:YVTN family beta-propeller protein